MATLTAEERKALPDSAFALPGRRYPIADELHARDALARVAADGTPAEQEEVRAAVHKRYPHLAKPEESGLAAGGGDRIPGLMLESDADFSLALTLGQDIPKQRNGIPCHAYWKESLKPARLTDARGKLWDITPKDIDDAVADTRRALALGHEPLIQDDHYKPTKSFGFIKGVRKNPRGGLDLLHVFMGDAERDEALRRKTSIMLLPNFKDEKGNGYKWFPDHSAVVFRPQFRGLNDYTPLAASNGQAVDAVTLTLANGETPMLDLTALRAALGEQAKDKPDDQVLALSAAAVTALADTRTKLRTALGAGATDKPDDQLLVLAADQFEANTALATELTSVEEQLATANQRVLALSAGEGVAPTADEPSPRELALSAKLALKDVDLAEERRQITPKQATFLRERIEHDKGLALSASDGGNSRVDDLIAFAAMADGHIVPNKPIGQPVKPLALSGEKPADGPMTPERKQELMAEAGYTA